jgi:hypothetical protein
MIIPVVPAEMGVLAAQLFLQSITLGAIMLCLLGTE